MENKASVIFELFYGNSRVGIGFQKIAGRIFTIQISLNWAGRVATVPPLKCVTVLYSWNITGKFSGAVKSTGCSQLAQQLRREQAQTSPPALSKHAHIWEPPAFTVMLSSPAKPSHFPLLNHCVTVNHWWSSAAGPKIGLGAEKGWGRGNLSYVQPWVSQATVSRLFYLQILQFLLGAITSPCSTGYFCGAALTVPRSCGKESRISMRWSLHPG